MKRFTLVIVITLFLVVAAISEKNNPLALLRWIERFYQQFIPAIPGQPIRVRGVIDGDTIELINGDHLRYIGVDTPESLDPRKPVQCFSNEASAANRALVEGKEVTFHHDVSKKDKYGRWLGFVYLADGTFVNKKLIENGFAFSYPYEPDISKNLELNEAEAIARQEKRGLWSACEISQLSSGRKQTATINAPP